MTNTVRIDIEVNAAAATTAGQRIVEPMRRAADDIDKLFDKTSNQIGRSLDKIEQEAWKSGKGMDDAFGTAMSGLRRSLELAREEAEQTGAGLHSSVGQSLNEIRKNADQLAQSLKPVAQATVPVNANWEKTSRLISTELDRIERDAWDAGRGTDKAFQTSLASVRADFERIRDEGKRTGASLESELGGSLREVKQEMDRLRDSSEDAGNGIKDNLTDALSGLAGMAGGAGGDVASSLLEGITSGKAGLLGAGLALGGVLLDGLTASWEENAVGGLIAAQTGGTSAEAARLGDLAGSVFGDNFGSSIQEVGAAITALFDNKLINTNTAEAAIEDLTGKLLTLAQTTGDTAEEIANSAHQLVVTGLARSVSQAFDMIQKAREEGLNASGDLQDTIQEYSTNFRTLGLSGEEAFGLLGQAIKGGARDTDFAADALKEFSILAQETGSTAVRGFTEIGLNAQDMGAKIAAGGSSAREALRETLNALQAIQDPVVRNSAAVDLFGTKAEDLGDALFSMDLDTAAQMMDDYGGSVERAEKAIADTAGPLERLGRKISEITSDIWDSLAEARSILDTADEVSFGGGEATDEATESTEEYTGAVQGAADANRDYIATIEDLISQQHELATGVMDLGEAQAETAQAYADANEAAKEFAGQGLTAAKDSFDLNTEAGRELQGSMHDVVDGIFETMEAMRQQGATSEETRAYLIAQREAFYNLLIQMGFLPDAAQAITDKLLGMPDDVTPTVGLQDNASGTIDYLNRRLNELEARPDIRTDYYLYTHYMSNSRAGGPTWGGTGGLETGGIVGVGNVWGAQSGGQRHSSTMIDEAGPEVVELPTGSRVMTAGATRALAEMGAFSGGGPVSVTVQLSADAGASAGEGQYIMGLVRRGVLRLKVASNGRDVVAA